MSLDNLLAAAGLIALASVIAFLVLRPGQSKRAKVTALLQARGRFPEHCIFLSYRRSDAADVVGRLYEHLVAEFGSKAVFKDIEAAIAGQDFREQIENSLARCCVLVCVIGKHWAGPPDHTRRIDEPGDFVRLEAETALRQGIVIIPVLVGGITMPPADFFPDPLRPLAYRNALQLRPDPDFHSDAAHLISSIAWHLSKTERAR